MARAAVQRAARVRAGLAGAGRQAPAPRPPLRRTRRGGLVLRALPLGVAGRRRCAGLPCESRPRRGCLPRVPARPRGPRGDARTAIAREERALIVEGNTDVLALRQAELGPVVASMGTALTERQLKELSRLTRKLYLCFDADAAGEAATLRGMDLAAAQGFDVRVVALPPGTDPADAAEGFEERLAKAESYVFYRVRLELERAPDRQEAFVHAREILSRFEDSPERQQALRLVADRLDLPRETQAGLVPRRGGRGTTPEVSPKLLEAGERLERDALAGVAAHPDLREVLAGLSPDHFDSDLHRRAREHLLEPGEADRELVQLLAELDARAAAEGIDEATTKELLLNLHERRLRRELQNADLERTKELQEELERLRSAATNLV